jgi:hypothetical protein
VIVQKVRVNVDEHPTLPLLLLVEVALNTAEPGLVFGVQCKVEVGFLGPLLLQHPVLIIDIVEIVDGSFAW